MAVYFLNTHQETIGMISFDDAIEVFQEQEIKDDSSLLNDVATVTIKNDKKLAEAAYFAIRAYAENKQTFDVYEVHSVKTDKTTTFTGVQLAARELEGYVVEDIRPENRSIEYVANQILAGTDWQIGYVESGLPIVTSTFYYLSVKDALKQLQSFGCEFKFKVEISGNQITDKFIEIYSQMGDRTGQRFTYGHNALTIVREISNANIYTALIGRGKGEESGDGYGRKLTFEDIEWKKTKGDPVDKPLGQKYVELPEATEIYGIQTFDGKRPRIGIVEFNDEEDKSILLRSTYQALLDTSRPLVQFQSTVAAMGNLKIGDTVTVHRYDLGIHYETRIFKVIRNRKNNKATELSLGDKVSLSSTERQRKLNSTVSELNKTQNDIKTDVSYVLTNAVGNRITYGNAEPDRKRVGDMWYRDHPSLTGEKQMLIWNGEGWDITLDTSIENSVAEEVEAIRQEMDANKTATEQAINQAIADANAYAEQQTSALKTEVEASNEILDTAIAVAQNRADTAFADAEIAKNNAFTATQTAQTAINDSITAINNAQTALDSFTAISGDLSELDQSVQTKFTSIDGQISNMVTQTTFNALDQKVTSQGTLISQTQSTLLSKADKTVVDAIDQTVGQHTTQIEQNAQAITARLTETQINNLLGTKNYVNQTTLTATANGLNASITQVSNDLSNLEIGGRNLIIRTGEMKSTVLGVTGLPSTGDGSTPKEKIAVKPGETLMFSKTSAGDDYWRISWFDQQGNYINRMPTTSNAFKFTVPEGTYFVWASYPTGSQVKIERGDKITDWSPAPEDMATLEQFTTIDATVKGLQTTVGNKAEQSQVTQLAGQISSKVESSTYSSKMTQLDSAISQRVTSTTFESRITQLDNSIDLKVKSGIDGLEIGGRNLVRNGDFGTGNLQDWNNNGGVTYQVVDGKKVAKMGTTSGLYQYLTTRPSLGIFTFSFLAKADTAGVSARVGFLNGIADNSNSYFTLSTEWKRYSFTIKSPLTNDHIFHVYSNGTPYYVTEIKVESGNKATAYSSAPEEIVTQINLSTEGVLIAGKRIRLDGEVTMEQAFISRLDTLTLNAVTANITTIRAQVLQANVVTSTHLQTSTATIDKLFATDAMVSRLTTKTAFINSVKAIDIAADRITTGTLNAANVSIINLNVNTLTGNISQFIQTNWNGINTSLGINASGLTTQSGTLSSTLNAGQLVNSSGTKSGTVNALGMQIYDSANGQTTKLYSDGIEFNWYGVIRGIQQHSEGLAIKASTGSGSRLNSALHLITGAGSDKIAYLQLVNPDGNNNARLEMNGTQLSLRHPNGGSLDIADYQYNGLLGRINAGKFRTTTTDGRGIQMEVSQISVLGGNQTIYIMPSGSGELRIGNGSANPTLWPVRASQFIQGSSRASKTNIRPYTESAIDLLNELQVVSYNRLDDLSRGVVQNTIGFIAEDSPSIAVKNAGMPAGVDNYKMVTLAIKGVQELSAKTDGIDDRIRVLEEENQELKQKITLLERHVHG